MNIAVMGASQGVGLELVKLALAAGHEVTALVRHPGKPVVDDPRLTMAIGDIRDPAAVGNVVRGKHAVCICVGIPPTRKPVDVFSEGTRQVLEAMKSSPGSKLLAITGIGAGDSKGHGGFFYDRIINPLLLGTIYEDKNRQEALIKASGATWMIVRPGFLTNGLGPGSTGSSTTSHTSPPGRSLALTSPTSCSRNSPIPPTSARRRCCAMRDLDAARPFTRHNGETPRERSVFV